MVHKIPGLVIVGAALTALAPSSNGSTVPEATRDTCHPIYFCGVGGSVGDYLTPGPAPGGVTAAPTFYHEDCRYCQYEDGCHQACDGDGDENVQEAYRSILQGMADRSPERIAAAAPKARRFVTWNEARSALQLLGCNGQVVASVTFDPHAADRILEALDVAQ